MAFTRSNFSTGPGVVVVGSTYLYTDGNIQVEESVETFPIKANGYGQVDERRKASITKITFKPVGMFTSGIASVLQPYLNYTEGQSMAGSSDTAVIVWPFSGVGKRTYPCGFISNFVGFQLASTKTVWGNVEITCIGKNATAQNDSAKFLTLADAAMSDTSLSASGIKTVPYTASIGVLSSPWDAIKVSADGVKVSGSLETELIEVDGEGYVDMILKGVKLESAFQPMGVTAAQVLTLFTAFQGQLSGASMAGLGATLTVTGGTGNPQFVGYNATLMTAPHNFQAGSPRIGELKFSHQRNGGTGALATLGVAS